MATRKHRPEYETAVVAASQEAYETLAARLGVEPNIHRQILGFSDGTFVAEVAVNGTPRHRTAERRLTKSEALEDLVRLLDEDNGVTDRAPFPSKGQIR